MESTEQIINKLFSLQRFGIKPGLERISRLLEKLGNPQENFKSIHIAGTNGKGSVSSMIASILFSSGYKVGLYTSPHIIGFNERIKINGKEIDDEYLINYADLLLKESQGEEITFFEITTALAFKYFSDNNVDIAVIETGMGGRFDATNVINPLISIITSISFDHQEYLGNTIKEIAFEKAGIIKPNTPTVTLNRNPDAIDVIRKKCVEMKSELIEALNFVSIMNISFTRDFKMIMELDTKRLLPKKLTIGLCGYHQVENIQIVLAGIEFLRSKFKITEQSIRNGLKKVKKNTGLYGRIELIRTNPLFVIDVAHNPSAIEQLVKTLKNCGYSDTKWNLIFTAMSDKDVQSMLEHLFEITDTLIIPNLKSERAFKNFEIGQIARKIGFQNIRLYESIDMLIDEIFILNAPILMTGSFYLLGEFFMNKKVEQLGLNKRIYD